MTRVAVDAREFSVPGRATGIGRYLENMLLPLVSEADFEFVLFLHRPDAVPPPLREAPAIRIDKLPVGPARWVDQWVLPRRAARAECDVFFSPFYKGPILTGMPLIVTVHDITFLRLPLLSPVVRRLTRWYMGAVLRRADRVVVVSKFTERDLLDLFPGVSGKTSVLYSDMGEEWNRMLQNSEMGVKPKVSPEGLGRFFLYVGNFKRHKNVDLLVRAYAAARRSRLIDDYTLVLVGGDDRNAPAIQALVAELGLLECVHIFRDVDDYSLACFYHAAQWFVTASAYEGFGYPCVEAMVAGCPVICHPATSLIEVVGSAGLPIAALNQQEVVATLAEAAAMNPEERTRLVEAGRRQARLFKPGESARALAGICRTLHRGSNA
ncbi:MAG: glycosyltransferase family 4 protein [Kiritimatiellaeota bacterium]|nr:glycosyltransferase family 4 protein [Kiritimatiellota bacterium]